MKKALFILQIPPPNHGASAVGESIMKSSKINHKVNIDYVRFSTVPKSNHFKVLFRIIAFASLYIKVFYRLCCHRYNLIYLTPTLTGLAFYKDFFVVLIVKLFSKNIVYHFHNKGISVNKAVPKFIKRFFFKNVKVILLSKKLYSDISNYVEEKNVSYCANGVLSNSSQTKNKIINENIRLLFLSNLIESKGVFVLLEACRDLVKRNLAFSCHFVGPFYNINEEKFFSYINKNHLQQYVKYHGAKYNNDKIEMFKMADLFVFPTFYSDECFPLVILEAMSYGLPVISTNEGAISEIIDDGENGFIVEKKDAIDLADKIEILINDKHRLIEMGKAAKTKFENTYTFANFETNFMRILDYLLLK